MIVIRLVSGERVNLVNGSRADFDLIKNNIERGDKTVVWSGETGKGAGVVQCVLVSAIAMLSFGVAPE